MSSIRGKDTMPRKCEFVAWRIPSATGSGSHRRDLPGTPAGGLVPEPSEGHIRAWLLLASPLGLFDSYVAREFARGLGERSLREMFNRDSSTKATLETLGWKVMVVWECETHSKRSWEEALAERLSNFLGGRATADLWAKFPFL